MEACVASSWAHGASWRPLNGDVVCKLAPLHGCADRSPCPPGEGGGEAKECTA